MAFDSLFHYRKMREVGVPEEQAQAYIEVLVEISRAQSADVLDTSIFYNKLIHAGVPKAHVLAYIECVEDGIAETFGLKSEENPD